MSTKTYVVKKICDTAELRQKGMQGDTFEDGECCVFVYEFPHSMRFWGKGCEQDMWVSCISDGVVTCCKRLWHEDTTPKLLKGEGTLAVETLDRLYVGSEVVFDGDTVVVVS